MVSGHLARPGTREDVELQKELFNDFKAAAMKHLSERFAPGVGYVQIGMELGFENAWAVFKAGLDFATRKVVDDVQPKWLGKLAAVDVFCYSHPWEMMERARIGAWLDADPGLLGREDLPGRRASSGGWIQA